VSTVTDNTSNFKKAFVEYMKIESDSDDDDGDADDDDQLSLPDVDEILNTEGNLITDGQDNVSVIQLPPQIRCACHSMNRLRMQSQLKSVTSNMAECVMSLLESVRQYGMQ
jgi:hypothetical protein